MHSKFVSTEYEKRARVFLCSAIAFCCFLLVTLLLCWDNRAIAGDNAEKERYIDQGDVIIDVRSGLMWCSRDNGYRVDLTTARLYCKWLDTGGYADWRLPSFQELGTLYDNEACHSLLGNDSSKVCLTPLIELSSERVWTNQGRSYSFSSNFQRRVHAGGLWGSVLPVRKHKPIVKRSSSDDGKP